MGYLDKIISIKIICLNTSLTITQNRDPEENTEVILLLFYKVSFVLLKARSMQPPVRIED